MENVLLISTTDHYATWIGALIWMTFLVLFAICFIDVLFRRPDLSGVMKAVWAFFMLILPVIGVFAYLIFKPHDTRSAELQEGTIYTNTHARAYGPHVASTAEADIAHAQALFDAGMITAAELQDRKYRAEAGISATGDAPDFLKDKDTK